MGLTVEIVTPAGSTQIKDASSVSFQAGGGTIGILTGHRPMICAMECGILAIITPSGGQRFVVGNGLARVADNKVSLLLMDLLPEHDIIPEQALHDYLSLSASLAAPWAEGMEEERLEAWRLAAAKLEILGIKPPG